jgi:hypothetical protein
MGGKLNFEHTRLRLLGGGSLNGEHEHKKGET